MHMTPVPPENTAIGEVLTKFIAGDPSMFELMSDDIDFRIDHFRDETDTSWQQATSREGLMAMIERLGREVFPKGTQALSINTFVLGDGWHLTHFNQRFFYGVQQRDVTSLTYIISHETDGIMDFFRETVTTIFDT
ncbi:MAG: hypothetical protein ACRBBO_02580 [Cognatishimia sp.]